jgi:hypothetical protein
VMSSIAELGAVMAPSVTTATAGVGVGMLTGVFLMPALIAAGAGLYYAIDASRKHAQQKATEYEHATQVYQVQQGYTRSSAPVQQLEEHITATRGKNYAPQAATVAGVAVGAAALSALGFHSPVAHALSEEALNRSVSQAREGGQQEENKGGALVAAPDASLVEHFANAHAAQQQAGYVQSQSPRFVERYAAHAPHPDAAQLSHTERLGAHHQPHLASHTEKLHARNEHVASLPAGISGA